MKKIKKVGDSEYHIHLFTCGCGSTQHQMGIMFWKDIMIQAIKNKELPECFLWWQIDKTNLWGRIKNAFWYIFKRENIYQEEIELDIADIEELKDGLNEYLKFYKKIKTNELINFYNLIYA